jgi:hypothetical protein
VSKTIYKTPQMRFGLLCNSLLLENWQAETIRQLRQQGIELELIVVKFESEKSSPRFVKKLRSYPFHQLLFRLWNRFLFKPKSKLAVDISPEVDGVEHLYCEPLTKGFVNYFSSSDITLIKARKLDFLLRFGFNIIKGDILQAARYGVWSFHHDDERVVRGGPPGFWEFMQQHQFNGVILQQLTEKLDKGLILKRHFYKVITHAYKAHLDQLYFESSRLPLQVCRQIIHNPGFEAELSQSKTPVKHPPSNRQMLHYFFKSVSRRIGFHLKDVFQQEDWNIGLIKAPLKNVISSPEKYLKETIWLKKVHAATYLADPFIIATPTERYLFYELYDYRKGKAVLACRLESEDFGNQHIVLEESHHLSFPFVFIHKGELYCLPESFSANKLSLYRFDAESLKLNWVKDLLEGLPVIDPVLQEYEGRWYLFFTLKDLPSVHLYVYHAADPFGTFEPHANNPVKSDIRSSRPAGALFRRDGKLIRPAQDCSLHYGRAVQLNEIVKLSPQHFEEKCVQRIMPELQFTFNQGLHSLNGDDLFTVIDGKRFTFTLAGFWHQLKLKLNKKA